MSLETLKQNYEKFKKAVIALAQQSLDLYNSCFDENANDECVEDLFNLLEREPEIKAVYDALANIDL